MAILSEQYEPELKTIRLDQKYPIEASQYSNYGFVNHIKSIEVLEDKDYTVDELIDVVRNSFIIGCRYIKVDITADTETIVIKKRYVLSKHSRLNAEVTIYYNQRFWTKPQPMAPPAGQVFYMDYVGTKK